MKNQKLIILGIIIIVAILCIWLLKAGQPWQTAKLNMTVDEWTWDESSVTSSIVEIREGEEFGPKVLFPPNQANAPFKMLEVIDENNVKISYYGLIIKGQQIAETTPKQGTKIISFEKTCFITPTLDSGTTICLNVVR